MNSTQRQCLYNRFKAPLFILFFLTFHVAFAQTDFLGIPSITLDGQIYKLRWSTNAQLPFEGGNMSQEDYKSKWLENAQHRTRIIQEYLLSDESVTSPQQQKKKNHKSPNESVIRYKTKVIAEYIRSDKTMEDIVEAKLADLDNEKQEGRVLNYSKLENADPNEIVLEFLIGNVYDGITYSIEWNVYRYRANADGVILFAMSKRAYEEKNVTPFMQEARENRLNWINSIVNYKLPSLSPSSATPGYSSP